MLVVPNNSDGKIGIKDLFFLLVIYAFTTYGIYSQNRIINGRVIADDLDILPGVTVIVNDTTEVGRTDLNGFFQVNIPADQEQLLFTGIGLDQMTIHLEEGCDRIEVVMMISASYDFITLKQADRKRKKEFKKLHEVHKKAFEKGIFETASACYTRKFEPYVLNKR